MLTLHELVGSGHIELARPEEAQHQGVRLVPEALQHQLGQLVSLRCSLLHQRPQLLQRRHPPVVRLIQLILRLEKGKKNMQRCLGDDKTKPAAQFWTRFTVFCFQLVQQCCRSVTVFSFTFCTVWPGSLWQGPNTGPWSFTVRCSSLDLMACSSSDTIR